MNTYLTSNPRTQRQSFDALSFLSVLVFGLFLPSCTAELCPLLSEGFGQEYAFSDSGKLSVVGFEASVSYLAIPADSVPSVTIKTASETPFVYTADDGTLIITPDTCSDPAPESSAFSTSPNILGSSMMSMLLPHRLPSMTVLALLGSMMVPTVVGEVRKLQECVPTLEIEVAMPMGAAVTENFGETDHYLAATVDTVTWGYYDPNATAVISMESGETITVEIITHHSGHDYAKMIKGDPAVEEIFYWEANQTLLNKPEPKLPGSGVHLVTGPINVEGAEVGDVIQVDILELDPRYNPETGRCFGTNSQKFAGYQYRTGFKRDGTPYVRTGGTEAITVFEFLESEDGDMLYGKPVYMYRFPNMTAPDGSVRTFDNNPAVMVPHEFDHGYDGELLSTEPIAYPEGFDDTVVTDEGGIQYLSPEFAKLEWKAPLRPHLGTLAVMPNNTANYIDGAATGGASTIPPARFGGNIDDWRIGKGGTMFYNVEVPGGLLVVGDTHAAQGDSELAGTAMETSMTTKLRVTLHKKDALPKQVATMDFPLLETSTQFVVHGFAYDNYLDDLEDASTIFAEGASLDLAMADCFIKTRNWLMDVFDLLEEETIALMTTSVDFGITQVVDGNWGVSSTIPKWALDDSDEPFDYSCTTSKTAGRRNRRSLKTSDRRKLLNDLGVDQDPETYASQLFGKVSQDCTSCKESMDRHVLAHKLLDAKLLFVSSNSKLD